MGSDGVGPFERRPRAAGRLSRSTLAVGLLRFLRGNASEQAFGLGQAGAVNPRDGVRRLRPPSRLPASAASPCSAAAAHLAHRADPDPGFDPLRRRIRSGGLRVGSERDDWPQWRQSLHPSLRPVSAPRIRGGHAQAVPSLPAPPARPEHGAVTRRHGPVPSAGGIRVTPGRSAAESRGGGCADLLVASCASAARDQQESESRPGGGRREAQRHYGSPVVIPVAVGLGP